MIYASDVLTLRDRANAANDRVGSLRTCARSRVGLSVGATVAAPNYAANSFLQLRNFRNRFQFVSHYSDHTAPLLAERLLACAGYCRNGCGSFVFFFAHAASPVLAPC